MSDKQRQCVNCAYPARIMIEYGEDLLYEVCSSTFLGRTTSHPRQYGEQAPLFQSLGWIANRILDEVRAQREERR